MGEREASPLGGVPGPNEIQVPGVVTELAAGRPIRPAWRNELGGLTFQVGHTFVKWNPRRSGIDLDRERIRLQWLAGRHPAPIVIEFGADESAQWLVTTVVPGEPAIGHRWRARRREAIAAIAAGLRALHAIPLDDVPPGWTGEGWVGRAPKELGTRPPVEVPVIVHGDACAPNTLISADGEWTGNVDFGDLTVGDRWADLAIASLSLDWNFGEGHEDELFDAYGIDRDEERIRYYRALWDLES
jgi:kanamycin kinase